MCAYMSQRYCGIHQTCCVCERKSKSRGKCRTVVLGFGGTCEHTGAYLCACLHACATGCKSVTAWMCKNLRATARCVEDLGVWRDDLPVAASVCTCVQFMCVSVFMVMCFLCVCVFMCFLSLFSVYAHHKAKDGRNQEQGAEQVT